MNGEIEIYRVFRERDFARGPVASNLCVTRIDQNKPLIHRSELETLKNLEFYRELRKALNVLRKKENVEILNYHPEGSTSINLEFVIIAKRRQ